MSGHHEKDVERSEGDAALPLAIDVDVERRVRRKLDRNLLPLLAALYLLAFLDRSNIGSVGPHSLPNYAS
jgi:hypothetical protein